MKFLIVFFCLCLLFMPLQVSAQEGSEAAGLTVVTYELPYPGILPDSNFYSLKMLRDRIVSMLISDPVKKAEFNLLQADKRLQAGAYLLNKDSAKSDLAILTISKGENYFFEAIQNVKAAKKQGFYTVDIAYRLSLAARKHREVIAELSTKIPTEEEEAFQALVRQQEELVKNATALTQQNERN